MSRSKRKVSVYAYNKPGVMKEWKRKANKAYRAKVRERISNTIDWEEFLVPTIDEVSTLWDSPKDCTRYWMEDKPDDDMCVREWSKFAGKRWNVRWIYFPDGSKKQIEVKLIDLPELVDGHFQEKRGYRWESCRCIRNKNSSYWKNFRK